MLRLPFKLSQVLLFIYQTVAESFGSPNLNGAITRKYKVPLTISAYGDGLVAKGEIVLRRIYFYQMDYIRPAFLLATMTTY